MDLYGHLVPGANRSAVDRLAAATNCNLYATDEEAREERREVSSDEDWSRRRDLNPRPADYEALSGFFSGSRCVTLGRAPFPVSARGQTRFRPMALVFPDDSVRRAMTGESHRE